MNPPASRWTFDWLKSLRTKIVIAMMVVSLTTTAAITISALQVQKKAVLHDFQVFVRSVAGTTALAFDGDSLRSIHSNADVSSPAFQKARSILERSQKLNGLNEQEIYLLRPRVEPRDSEFIVMLHKQPFVGDRYRVQAENWPRLVEAWQTGVPTNTGLYRDPHGSWISGYAPIQGSDGRAVAIIEVDAEVSRYTAELDHLLWLSLLIGLGALTMGMLPGLWLANSITGGLQKLTMGIQRFRAGENSVQVISSSDDEVGALSSAFNDLFVGLQDKLALLPYVSRLNAEAVQRSRIDPGWLSGREEDVIVLFADLRGFTSFAEGRNAQALVSDLNQLLSLQANVVISAGGDVDKFIGDAVMAIFLDNSESADHVFACACQMIDHVRSEITLHDWPLALGIGIHRGKVVVGSIGAATRRDFTAIGHTTNLASRLCSHAAPWEILSTDTFYASLNPENRAAFHLTESIPLKNVAQKVVTYSCHLIGE